LFKGKAIGEKAEVERVAETKEWSEGRNGVREEME